MIHFTPTFEVIDTARNVKKFIKDNMATFWEVLKPLAPFIAGLYIFDLIITSFFMPIDNETGQRTEFSLGSIIAGYFYTCLAITWHRVVIHGNENFTPMNPFKPKKSELAFIGMGMLLFIGTFAISFILGFGAALISPILIIFLVPLSLIAMFIWMKCMFYFPSKATGNSITLKQSYKMTKGYVWKLFASYVWASFILFLIVLAYAIGGAMILGLLLFAINSIAASLAPIFTVILGAAFILPLALFFQPIFAIIWVTVLSNYYQYVLQNGAKENND